MLRWRLILGVLFAGSLVGLLWADARFHPAGLLLFPVVLAIAVLASQELIRLLRMRQLDVADAIVYAGNVGMAFSAAPWLWGRPSRESSLWLLATLVAAIVAAFLEEMRNFSHAGSSLMRLSATILALCYVGLLLGHVVALRMVAEGAVDTAAIFSLLLIVKLSDIGAYTMGRLLGRYRLAPRLSPGKTIEGAIGGVLAGLLGAWISVAWLIPAMATGTAVVAGVTPWRWMLFGLLITGAGMLGDLAESLIKRDAGVKDSSDWMPGFGGVLDLADSVLFAAPVAYWCWMGGLLGY